MQVEVLEAAVRRKFHICVQDGRYHALHPSQ